MRPRLLRRPEAFDPDPYGAIQSYMTEQSLGRTDGMSLETYRFADDCCEDRLSPDIYIPVK